MGRSTLRCTLIPPEGWQETENRTKTFHLFFFKIYYIFLSLVSIVLQSLREAIQQEYREAVERRVFTGLFLSQN